MAKEKVPLLMRVISIAVYIVVSVVISVGIATTAAMATVVGCLLFDNDILVPVIKTVFAWSLVGSYLIQLIFIGRIFKGPKLRSLMQTEPQFGSTDRKSGEQE